MDLSKNTLTKMELEFTSVDIEELGLVKPRFDVISEQKLAAVSRKILKMRKPFLYWKVLAANPITLSQITEYARKSRRDNTLVMPQERIYASILTQKQVIHVSNGGTIDSILQSDFAWVETDDFNRRKMNNPAHWLENHGLITILPLEKKARKGKSINIKLTNKGVCVYVRLREILEGLKIAHSLHNDILPRYGPGNDT